MCNSEKNDVSQEKLGIVGYWFNEKKSQKFGAVELLEACRERNILFKKIDIEKEFEDQGCFHVFLHKLTAVYAPAFSGESKAKSIISRVEKFLEENPQIILVDPLSSVKKLLLRFDTYIVLRNITAHLDKVFAPNFACLHHDDSTVNAKVLKKFNVTYPIVCKPLHAGGGKDAHQLSLVFNESRLKECSTPCVAQTFVKHNGVLYKIFVLGKRWFAAVRPSLKNFFEGDKSTISFNSHNVSKPDSCSPLNHSESEWSESSSAPKADLRILQRIVRVVKEALESDLLGIDVVIDVNTGDYAVIDVNPFPSFDSIPNVMSHIAELLRFRLDYGRSKDLNPTFCLALDIKQANFLQDLRQIKNIEDSGDIVNLEEVCFDSGLCIDDINSYGSSKESEKINKFEKSDIKKKIEELELCKNTEDLKISSKNIKVLDFDNVKCDVKNT